MTKVKAEWQRVSLNTSDFTIEEDDKRPDLMNFILEFSIFEWMILSKITADIYR